uniref:DUF4220 domain-containing protein n=1 Tax=Oryza brachyantha TaxID=4533 RepID=J3KZL4_ORYBR
MSSPEDYTCDTSVLELSSKEIRARILRTNAVLVISLVIVAILVGAGSFSRRYRRHGSIRLLFHGAYTLFVPLISYVVSDVHKENCKLPDGIECSDDSTWYLLVWACLVQIVGTNYCTAIPPHDDEPRNIGPTLQLLLGATWTLFLIVEEFRLYSYTKHIYYVLIVIPCGLSLAKILAKQYAHKNSKSSFELGGRNPRLILGYMEQLILQQGDEHVVPLILTGEDKQKVEEGPRGYRFTGDREYSSALVSVDKVANLASNDHSWRQYEDLCLSFSLFKLLRQRFTRCPVFKEDYGSVPNFMNKLQRTEDAQGIVSMIVDELSFACDFYYSYLPISYSSWWWLPILNVVLSFLVITYCIVSEMYLVKLAFESPDAIQISCDCGGIEEPEFGYLLVINVLTTFLAIAVILSEAWVIISYTCSNWTKVNLICYYITKTSRQGSLFMKKLILFMLQFRCKALNDSYKMGQTSIMETNMKIVKAVRRLLQLSDQKMEYVEIKPEVSRAILDKFRASNWSLPTVTATLQQSPIGNDILPFYRGEGTSDVILVWHVATCIFEIKHPLDRRTSAHAITASQLSRYCAYLLSSAPELLPDDKAWSKKLYKSVKKITEPIFSRSNMSPLQYDRILSLLDGKCSSNTELKYGVELGKLLVQKTQGAEQEGWEVLAGFWSAMVLYIAPSDNVGAHREAIARGGELITILWAMLTHAGIITRPRTSNDV